MPKLFSINIQVEEAALGRVMRLLNTVPGVAKFDLDMGNAAKNSGSSGGKGTRTRTRTKHDVSSQDLVNELFVKAKGPLKSREVLQALAKYGRTNSAFYTAIGMLKQRGWASGDQDKGYQLTAKGRTALTTAEAV